MSTRTRPSARRLAAFVAALGALVMSSGVVLLATAPGANAAPGDKWFVCKYVDTPGQPEKLQTGQNPISVSENAIPVSPVVAGAVFADKQGRSVVLKLDDTPPGPEGDPDVSACAPPSQNVLIAVDVVFVDPTCDNDNTASLSVTGDTDHVAVEQTAAAAPGASVTVTATAKPGFVFAAGASTYSESHTFPAAADCTVVTPPTPTPTPTTVVEPPAATPTVVHAGLVTDAADNTRSEQGIALLASGLLLLVAAGGLARPRGARQ